MALDPDQLVANARAGQAGALSALLVRLSDSLRDELRQRRLRGMSPSRSAADFVQDTLVRVQEHFATFSGDNFAELKRWSWRILYRRHQETRRNRRIRSSQKMVWKIWSALAIRKDLPGQLRKAGEDVFERREEALRAYRLFETGLRPHERNVIQLRLLDGLPFDEIAARVGKSVDAVSKSYHRALDRLRALFESDGKP